MVKGIQSGIQPIIVLALIGTLIGAWMSSGTIPTVMVYALTIINPAYLLITSLFSCMLISSLVGSSFTTVSTVGVALMGAGIAVGLPVEWVAGAVISGACFGDKMSPMSDTTNFASGVSKVEIFTHIRHMTKTTIPSIVLTIVIFFILSRIASIDIKALTEMANMITIIEEHIQISSITLLSPLLVIILAIRQVPVIPSLIFGIITAGITSVGLQGISIGEFLTTLQYGTSFPIENEHDESGWTAINDVVDFSHIDRFCFWRSSRFITNYSYSITRNDYPSKIERTTNSYNCILIFCCKSFNW
jgi:NhaC family Na+:H+ antiporter